ncbi:TPA: hypothetical protein G9F27_005709 [Salmonella enterica]|uniref:Phage coat protein n=1 Tax=Salmonella enterica TaxID=28901 RepID=A0A743PGI6_SALER|nr:hypothetical protein [Salmonella enterica]
MFKEKYAKVAGFVKENTSPVTMATAAVVGLSVAASPAFAAAPAPFSLTASLVDPIVTALATNFGVGLTAAFSLMAVTLVGKASLGLVKGVITRAF